MFYKPILYGRRSTTNPPTRQSQNKTVSTGFGVTGFNKFKVKNFNDMSYSKTNYSGAPWVNDPMSEHFHTTGDIATTNPETNSHNLMERSSTTAGGNWGERKKHEKKKKEHIRGPDFKKLLSREYLEKLHENRSTVIPFKKPNYNYIMQSKIEIINILKRTNNPCKI